MCACVNCVCVLEFMEIVSENLSHVFVLLGHGELVGSNLILLA